MNQNSISTESSHVVDRLVNVLVTEVLLRVSKDINTQLVSISNRLVELERSFELETDPNEGNTLADRIRKLGSLAERVRELEEKIEDTATADDLRSLDCRVDDLERTGEDVDSAVTQLTRDLDDARRDIERADCQPSMRDIVEVVCRPENAEQVVRSGLRSMVAEEVKI